MISRALGISVILAAPLFATADPLVPNVDGKVLPAITQDYFEPDMRSVPRLLPLAIRESLPGKFAPPTAGLIPFDLSSAIPVLARLLNPEGPLLTKRVWNQSPEPPLVQIP